MPLIVDGCLVIFVVCRVLIYPPGALNRVVLLLSVYSLKSTGLRAVICVVTSWRFWYDYHCSSHNAARLNMDPTPGVKLLSWILGRRRVSV